MSRGCGSSRARRVLIETEDAFSGQIRTNDDRRDKTKQPVRQSADGADLGRRCGAGRYAGGDDRRDSPAHRPVRHAHQRSQAACRMAGDRVPARHARLPDPRRPDPLERDVDDSLHADARLHRHRAGHGRAHHHAGRHARRQHGHRRGLPGQHRLSAGVRARGVLLPGRCPRRDGARRALGQRPGDAQRDDRHDRSA